MRREILLGERNWELLTVGECILGRCMVRCADPLLLGDCMGREILLGERNWETIDCKRVHSV